MPSAAQILESLFDITGELWPIAVGWHLAIVIVLIALARGWRPARRRGLWLLTAPVASVAIIAFVYGNWFNGISFAVLAAVLALLAGADDADRTAAGARWSTALGIVLIGFGLVYPHFVEGPWYASLVASPVGLVPCPTLAVVAGFALLADGFAGRVPSAVLAAWTAFYALFGLARLGVAIDVGLVLAAAGLFARAVRGAGIHLPHAAPGTRG